MGNTHILATLLLWIAFWGFLTQGIIRPIAESMADSQAESMGLNQPNMNTINASAGLQGMNGTYLGTFGAPSVTEGTTGVLRIFAGFSAKAASGTPEWLLGLLSIVNAITLIVGVWIVIVMIRGTS